MSCVIFIILRLHGGNIQSGISAFSSFFHESHCWLNFFKIIGHHRICSDFDRFFLHLHNKNRKKSAKTGARGIKDFRHGSNYPVS